MRASARPGPTSSWVFLSAIVDNIPVMFAVLKMDPQMGIDQWLLVTLTAGVGGRSLVCRFGRWRCGDGRRPEKLHLPLTLEMVVGHRPGLRGQHPVLVLGH